METQLQTYVGDSAHIKSALVFDCPVCQFSRPAEDWCRDCWCCEVCCDCDVEMVGGVR